MAETFDEELFYETCSVGDVYEGPSAIEQECVMPVGTFRCTRAQDHRGRHVAEGLEGVLATRATGEHP
jgi:hypothetical protein